MAPGIPERHDASAVEISPSMMCADPFHLAEVVKTLEGEGVEWMHIDIMDGRYVPNFTLGPDYCKWLKRASSLPLDVHLMVEEPGRHIEKFALAGTRITFHPDACRQPVRVIESIQQAGCSPGIALDPSLTLDSCRHLIPLVDQILIMTVSPGYAGQSLLPWSLGKISEARAMLDSLGSRAKIEVDGCVSWENIPLMVEAGADILVAGTSSLFVEGRVSPEAIRKFRSLAQRPRGILS